MSAPCSPRARRSESTATGAAHRTRSRGSRRGAQADAPASQVVPARGYKVSVNSQAFIVSVNGRPSRYFRVNHAFKGVVIPSAGDWEVVFEYPPARWRVSWILAGVAVVGRAYHAGTSDASMK